MMERSWTVISTSLLHKERYFRSAHLWHTGKCPLPSLVYIYCTSSKVSLPLYTPATPFPLQVTLYIQKGRESNHHAAAGFRP